MIRNVEIEDNLQEILESLQYDLTTLATEWLDENKDADEAPDLGNDLDYSGAVHEMVDGAVPVYTYEINNLWYLYRAEFEDAYNDAGIGDNPLENDGMAAIYCYLWQELCEWYEEEKDAIYEEWRKKNTSEEDENEEDC